LYLCAIFADSTNVTIVFTALSELVKHVSVPSESSTGTVVFGAALIFSVVISGGESRSFVGVLTAADHLVVVTLARGFIDFVATTDASVFNDEETFVGRFGPDTMTGFGPVSPVFVETDSQTFVALADSSGAVILNSLLGESTSPTVSTSNTTLFVTVWATWVPVKFVSISSQVGVASTKVLFSTSVTEPKVHTSFINVIDWSTGTGGETVSTFWQAPATVETVSGNTFVFWLHPRNEFFKISESFHGTEGLFSEF